MSKRNFILLIIILALIIISVYGFLYFRKDDTDTTENTPETNFVSRFNPFGTKPPAPSVSEPIPEEYQPEIKNGTGKLTRVSSVPVAGFIVFNKERLKDLPVPAPIETADPIAEEGVKDKKKKTKPVPPPTEFVSALRYVDKANGNIYQTFADKIEERRFSTTIVPKVHEAYFGSRGETVIMRYLKEDGETIQTFVGSLPKEMLGGDGEGSAEIKGSFLQSGIRDISLSPDGSKMFYLFDSGENASGIMLNFATGKKAQIFSSPFTEWLSFWPANNIITLTTRPSARVPGYVYSIDGVGKNLIKIFGDVNGLTTLASPNGKLILFNDNNLSLYIYREDTRNSGVLGIKTLPEKCVWGKESDVLYCSVPRLIPTGGYPDSWYQGETSFSDQIWKIDVSTKNTTLLFDSQKEREEEFDGIRLALDEKEDYLFFMNKKNPFLWKLDLK